MRGLLYKDLLLSRLYFGLILGLQLCSTLGCYLFSDHMSNTPDDVYLIKCIILYVPFFFASLVNGDIFKSDERRIWCHFVISSPQAARGQILCKYIMLCFINLILLVCGLLTDLQSCKMLGTSDASAWKILIVFFAMNTILNAIEVPFMIRFGTARGMNIKGAIFGAVFSAAYICFLFANLSFIREHNVFNWLLELVTTGPDMTKICIWMSVIAVVLYSISYYISILLYRAGVEAYEN